MSFLKGSFAIPSQCFQLYNSTEQRKVFVLQPVMVIDWHCVLTTGKGRSVASGADFGRKDLNSDNEIDGEEFFVLETHSGSSLSRILQKGARRF